MHIGAYAPNGATRAMATAELAAILRRLKEATGLELSARTFDGRLRIQKAIYFLKAFGYEPAREYSFGDYFYGPYSPRLADQYYELQPGLLPNPSFDAPALPPRSSEFLREATRGGNDVLEAAATLHAFFSRNRSASGAEAIEYLREVKGRLADLGREALSLLRRYGLAAGAT